jgi:hypothetical protein
MKVLGKNEASLRKFSSFFKAENECPRKNRQHSMHRIMRDAREKIGPQHFFGIDP